MNRLFFAAAAVGLLGAIACGGTNRYGQTAECKAYVACFQKVGGSGEPTLPENFRKTGDCYAGNLAEADSCTAQCLNSTAALNAAYPDAGCPRS